MQFLPVPGAADHPSAADVVIIGLGVAACDDTTATATEGICPAGAHRTPRPASVTDIIGQALQTGGDVMIQTALAKGAARSDPARPASTPCWKSARCGYLQDGQRRLDRPSPRPTAGSAP